MRNFVGAVVALVSSTSATLAADPVGTYEISGTNPGVGSKYFGTAVVQRTGDTFAGYGVYGWADIDRYRDWKKRLSRGFLRTGGGDAPLEITKVEGLTAVACELLEVVAD